MLPVVGFEIEALAGVKTLKGSVANLNDSGPLMSIIAISDENIDKKIRKERSYGIRNLSVNFARNRLNEQFMRDALLSEL